MTTLYFPADSVTEVAVPRGHIASVVTYLQRTAGPNMEALTPLDASYKLEWTENVAAVDYKQLFKHIGGPWLWFSRINLDDDVLQRILDEPARHLALLRDGESVAGYVEMDASSAQNAYVSFIGLAPGYDGKGLGTYLMESGIARIWGEETRTISTHTCTLDHPGALGFYLKSGFTATRRSIEVSPDPRIKGLLAPEIRPEYPLL